MSYREELDKTLAEYESTYLQPLSKFKPVPPIPSQIVELLSYEKDMTHKLNSLKAVKIPPIGFDASIAVKEKYDSLEAAEKERRGQLIKQAEEKKYQMRVDHARHAQEIQQYNANLIIPVKQKHEELLSYQDDLEYVFKHYDISPLDMDISDNTSIEEFNTLIDESLTTCKKYMRKDNELFNKLTKPLQGETDLRVTACFSLAALLFIYLFMPILAVPAFIILFLSVHNMYKDLEKLRISCALMSQIDYNRFVPKEQYKQVEELNTSSVDEDLDEQLGSIKDYSNERDAALEEAKVDNVKIAEECENSRNKLIDAYNIVINEYAENLKKAKAAISEIMSNYKPFPTVQNSSVVMSHNYTLGRIEDKLDVVMQLPCKNIVFDSSNREAGIANMKLYLANALLSVRVKQLTIEIFDPKNMCSDFTEFFTPDTKPYIKPNNATLDELLKTYRKYSQENILVLDKQPIDVFNKKAEEAEIVPKEYKLLLIISEFEKLSKGDEEHMFKEYFKYSAESGVMIWLLDNKKYENALWVDDSYTLQGEKIVYDSSLGKKAVDTFTDALSKFKDSGIDYVAKFGNVFIPREKWWTFDTIKGINMPYGLENGDPTRGLNVAPVIGDANVHALLGGATGAGKSAAINQLLISLITMYPPSELQIIYIDFKNVEAAKFTRGYDKTTEEWFDSNKERDYREKGMFYNRLSRIPHLRIISGTTDGEYALSVFEFLMKEMAHRQEIINKFGVTKIQEMREQILANYNLEHNGDKKKGTWADMRRDWDWYKPNVYDKYGDLPRMLVIFDEFQVMYNPEFVDSRTIDTINSKITAITKLARAMATHFWFTSQSMKGTMSKDTIANFSLRGALRCTADVSEELLGTKAASTIKSKFGFMYTNDSAGQNKDANRFWRVPFLDEKKMPEYIDTLNAMLPEFNEKHDMAEFYDEKILVPVNELDNWYKTYPDTFNDSSVFILGERANFSTNKAPVAISLQDDGGENIMLAAFDRQDMLNLTMTMIKNLKNKDSDCTIIMNVQDAETHTMLDVENIVEPKFLSLSSPKQDVPELINALEAMVENRMNAGPPYSKVYVFCVQWERAPGISVDINYKLGDQFKDILRKGPNVGVHFIFACREKLDMQRFIPGACNHRIVGLMPKDSNFFIETTKVEKLPDASKDAGLFAFYEFGTTLTKFRIYQNKFTKEVKSREIVL